MCELCHLEWAHVLFLETKTNMQETKLKRRENCVSDVLLSGETAVFVLKSLRGGKGTLGPLFFAPFPSGRIKQILQVLLDLAIGVAIKLGTEHIRRIADEIE